MMPVSPKGALYCVSRLGRGDADGDMEAKHMAIETLLQAVIAASPAKRRELERVIRGEATGAPTATGKEENRLVTITGAARLLALGRNTVYRLIETGRLDVVDLNGARRVTMKSLKEFADGARPANERTAELVAASGKRYAQGKATADGANANA